MKTKSIVTNINGVPIDNFLWGVVFWLTYTTNKSQSDIVDHILKLLQKYGQSTYFNTRKGAVKFVYEVRNDNWQRASVDDLDVKAVLSGMKQKGTMEYDL